MSVSTGSPNLCVLIQEIEEVTFITHLAGLTDHIPVGLRLNVVFNSEGDK